MSALEPCKSTDQPGWLALREALWPETTRQDHLAEMSAFLEDPARYAQFVAYRATGEPCGFAEASVPTDHVHGTLSSPVAFLEGLYVAPQDRRQGVAKQLVGAVAQWARQAGCTELASDTALDDEISRAVHRALGFAETERVVFFRKRLP
jgi:aminoglycoside 6'-N-acetyltransferase I